MRTHLALTMGLLLVAAGAAVLSGCKGSSNPNAELSPPGKPSSVGITAGKRAADIGVSGAKPNPVAAQLIARPTAEPFVAAEPPKPKEFAAPPPRQDQPLVASEPVAAKESATRGSKLEQGPPTVAHSSGETPATGLGRLPVRPEEVPKTAPNAPRDSPNSLFGPDADVAKRAPAPPTVLGGPTAPQASQTDQSKAKQAAEPVRSVPLSLQPDRRPYQPIVSERTPSVATDRPGGVAFSLSQGPAKRVPEVATDSRPVGAATASGQPSGLIGSSSVPAARPGGIAMKVRSGPSVGIQAAPLAGTSPPSEDSAAKLPLSAGSAPPMAPSAATPFGWTLPSPPLSAPLDGHLPAEETLAQQSLAQPQARPTAEPQPSPTAQPQPSPTALAQVLPKGPPEAPPAAPAEPSGEKPKPVGVSSEPPGLALAVSDDAPGDAQGSGRPKQQEDSASYQVMTVFYGTDRQALESPISGRWSRSDWAYLTAILGGVSLILGAIAFCHPRNRAVLTLAVTAAAGTGLFGYWTYRAGRASASVAQETMRTYGNDRGSMEMGVCRVTIPKVHETGELERPSIFRFQFQEDPRRHVVLVSVEQKPDEEFFAALQSRVAESAKKEALVFVHGFNVTFETAARRTAQLAYDLKFDGAAIFFSWPSQGGLLRYAVDETNVAWSVPHLKDFLVAIARRSGAKSVNLIAHSMGNRALTAALQMLSYELKGEPPMFREVVLTAPDIDADVFKRDIAPAIVRTASRVTLYASSSDEALRISKEIHGYPRAGDSGRDLVVVPGIDTIDVSKVDSSLIGHSYYGENDTVLADLYDLLQESKPPDRRPWLRPVPAGEMNYWVFTSPRERASALRQAEEMFRQ